MGKTNEKLLSKIDKNNIYRNPLGGNKHYKVDIYSKETLNFIRHESLCDANIDTFNVMTFNNNVTCKSCLDIYKRYNRTDEK